MGIFYEAISTGLDPKEVVQIIEAASVTHETPNYEQVVLGLGYFARYQMGLSIDTGEDQTDTEPSAVHEVSKSNKQTGTVALSEVISQGGLQPAADKVEVSSVVESPARPLEVVPPPVVPAELETILFEPYGPLGDTLQRLIRDRELDPWQAVRLQTHSLRALEGLTAKKDERQGTYKPEYPLREEDLRLVERLYSKGPTTVTRLLPELLRSREPIHTGLTFFAEERIKRVEPPAISSIGSDKPNLLTVLAYSLSTHLAAELELVLAQGK